MSRLEKIRQMLIAEPRDLFLRYALAMELDSSGQPEESLMAYHELMRDQPAHVPSFFRAGQLLIRMGRIDEAKSLLEKGIRHALDQGDTHASGEMNELLESIELTSDEL